MSSALVTLNGNLTADPELRFTQNGIPVAGFNVAHTSRRLNRETQEWEDFGETLFMRVNVWREQAENIAASLRKGDSVVVIGRLVSRPWTKDGEKRTSIECDADIVSVDLRRARIDRVMRQSKRQTPEAPESWSAPADSDSAPAPASA